MKKRISHGRAKGLKQRNTIGRGGWRRATKVLDWRIEDSEDCEMSQDEPTGSSLASLSGFNSHLLPLTLLLLYLRAPRKESTTHSYDEQLRSFV